MGQTQSAKYDPTYESFSYLSSAHLDGTLPLLVDCRGLSIRATVTNHFAFSAPHPFSLSTYLLRLFGWFDFLLLVRPVFIRYYCPYS